MFAYAYRGQQRGVEPAAILVTAFKVEVGGRRDFGLGFHDGMPGDAGVEPDIENVHLFSEVGVAAIGAPGAGREQLLGFPEISFRWQYAAFLNRPAIAFW